MVVFLFMMKLLWLIVLGCEVCVGLLLWCDSVCVEVNEVIVIGWIVDLVLLVIMMFVRFFWRWWKVWMMDFVLDV